MAKQKTNKVTISTAIGKPPQIGQSAEYQDKDYPLSDETNVCGGGEPMKLPFLIERIKAYYKEIEANYKIAVESKNEASI